MAKAPKTQSTPTPPASSLYGPGLQAPGRPYVYKFPTPLLNDRIFSVRVDSRAGAFVLPNKGDPYEGQDADQFKDFLFATAIPIEGSPGWWNLFYLNEHLNQESYNYTIEYPYTDPNYPKLTRTYVFLRGTMVEPNADELDPIFNGIVDPTDPDPPTTFPSGTTTQDPTFTSKQPLLPPGIVLVLTDHKTTRFEDPILDALFIGVTRIYENLPGPILTTYKENAYQQIETVQTQEVITGTTPIADALTDEITVERTTTAKQKNMVGRVPDVPAKNIFTQLWSSPYRDFLPIAFRYLNPLVTAEHDEAGIATAADAILGPVDTTKTVAQITEFRRHISTTSAPIHHTVLQEERLSPEQQLVTITQTLDAGVQDISPDLGALLISGKVEQVGLGATIKTEETVTSVFPRQEEAAEIPDLIPVEFRAFIPTVIEAQTKAGIVSIGVPPTLGPGELRRRNIQETEFKERIEVTKRLLPTLPFTFTNFKLLEDLKEGMGGVLSVTLTLDNAPLTIDQGFFVTRSDVKQIGGGLWTKETDKLVDEWPVLQEVRTDPQTGIIINIIKTMILPLPAPTPGHPGVSNPNDMGGGNWVDVLPIDKWRSIQIVSRVDCASLPAPLTWATSYRYIFPPQLLTITPYWEAANKREVIQASSTDIHGNSVSGAVGASALVYTSAKGKITYTATAGFHGDFPGFITRIYTCGPPSPSQIPNVFQFQPSDGSAIIAGSTGSYSLSEGPGGGFDVLGAFGGQQNITAETVDIDFLDGDRIDLRGMLTGFYTQVPLVNAIQASSIAQLPVVSAFASGPTDSYTPTVGGGFVTANMIVSLPISNPLSYGRSGGLAAGSSILVAVNTQRWRFGVFVTEQVYITVPTVP